MQSSTTQRMSMRTLLLLSSPLPLWATTPPKLSPRTTTLSNNQSRRGARASVSLMLTAPLPALSVLARSRTVRTLILLLSLARLSPYLLLLPRPQIVSSVIPLLVPSSMLNHPKEQNQETGIQSTLNCRLYPFSQKNLSHSPKPHSPHLLVQLSIFPLKVAYTPGLLSIGPALPVALLVLLSSHAAVSINVIRTISSQWQQKSPQSI